MHSAKILPFKELETCSGARADYRREDFIAARQMNRRDGSDFVASPPPFKRTVLRNLAGALVGMLALAGCTDEDGATKALRSAGLRPVHVGGYSFFGCDSKSDTFATEFTAINVNGETVSGVVCSGFLKGKTIRYD